MLSREIIQRETLQWVGTKWKHQGRNRNGIDCAGLIIKVAEALEYPIIDEKGYSRRPLGFNFVEAFQQQMHEIPKLSAQPGDILVFQDTHYPCHCGIMVELHGAHYMVHSHAIHRKVIIDHINSWEHKWCNSFKFRGIN